MKEDDGAGPDFFEHLLEDGFFSRTLVVGGLHRPEDDQHLVAAGQLQGGGIVLAERRPEEPREGRAEPPQFGRLFEQLGFLFLGRQAGELRVVLGVVADREAGLRLAVDPSGYSSIISPTGKKVAGARRRIRMSRISSV